MRSEAAAGAADTPQNRVSVGVRAKRARGRLCFAEYERNTRCPAIRMNWTKGMSEAAAQMMNTTMVVE